MKKQDLLKYFDDYLLDKLFGFCYARTNDSYEAEELCSDIIYALVKAANSDGEIESVYPFIWRVARNVYADFSNNRRKRAEIIYEGDSEEILLGVAEEDTSDDTAELLTSVYRRIAFLTKAYREVMIMFYIDGLSTAQIAKAQGTSEGAVRQRLFSARQKIKSEVEEMTETYNTDLLYCQRLFISCEADSTGNLCMKICVGIHIAVTSSGIPINSLIDLIHFIFSYPISDFLATYVQSPFDCGFGERILFCKTSDWQFANIVVHKNIFVLGR